MYSREMYLARCRYKDIILYYITGELYIIHFYSSPTRGYYYSVLLYCNIIVYVPDMISVWCNKK